MRGSSPVRRRSPQIKVAECGPFLGVRDALDPSVSNDPRYARELVNVMPLDLTKPSTMVGRPGFEALKAQVTVTSGTQGDFGRLVHHFVREDGEERTMYAFGRFLYAYNWNTPADTFSFAFYDLATRLYAVTFGDRVVVHDGANTPMSLDPIAVLNTSLANAPIFFGRPRIYYAKLFAIKADERSVIVWSEENDPTLGYETVPYSNSWQLGQTDQEPLYALAATNEALYYFRARSIGSIRGAVTPEFTTDGTHEGISQTRGTVSPDGVCEVGERVFFIDADAQPCVIQGGEVIPIYGFTETIRTLDKSKLDRAITRYDPSTGLVRFCLVEIGQDNPSVTLLVNPILNIAVGVHRGYVVAALGAARDAAGQSRFVHLSTDGYIYAHGTPDGDIWDDEFGAGTVAIAHAVESSHLATDTEVEKRFQRADLLMRVEDGTNDVGVRMITPYGSSTALEVDFASGGPNWDEFNWDEAAWGEDYAERHGAVGFNQVGRWARVRLEHQETGEKFGFTKLSVNHTPSGNAWQAA